VAWQYQAAPKAGSPEAELLESFLTPREWLK